MFSSKISSFSHAILQIMKPRHLKNIFWVEWAILNIKLKGESQSYTKICTPSHLSSLKKNICCQLFATLLLVAAPLSLAQNYGGQQAAGAYGEEEAQWGPAEYAYEYAVHDDHTNDIHSHKESRKGDLTQGEYSLVEADGTIRTVKYHVDGKSGFVAEVTHTGTPIVHAAPAPAYKPIVAAYKPVVANYVQGARAYGGNQQARRY